MKKLTSIPKEDGFRMPGEFEPHRGTYIIWPERPDNWPCSPLRQCYEYAFGMILPLLRVLLTLNSAARTLFAPI